MDHQPPSFLAWLAQHRRAETALGDLARDILADPSWPRGQGDLDEYRAYMLDQGAIPEAVETLEQAWNRFLTSTGDQDGQER